MRERSIIFAIFLVGIGVSIFIMKNNHERRESYERQRKSNLKYSVEKKRKTDSIQRVKQDSVKIVKRQIERDSIKGKWDKEFEEMRKLAKELEEKKEN